LKPGAEAHRTFLPDIHMEIASIVGSCIRVSGTVIHRDIYPDGLVDVRGQSIGFCVIAVVIKTNVRPIRENCCRYVAEPYVWVTAID
jgi:hypothetical protein